MTSFDLSAIKESLLIEGLMGAIALAEVHGDFFGRDAAHAPPVPEVQDHTLAMVRDLVTEGLFILGVPTRHGVFEPWNLPLDAAMTRIEDAYVRNFEDRRNWTNMVWLFLTDKGEELAKRLYESEDPGPGS